MDLVHQVAYASFFYWIFFLFAKMFGFLASFFFLFSLFVHFGFLVFSFHFAVWAVTTNGHMNVCMFIRCRLLSFPNNLFVLFTIRFNINSITIILFLHFNITNCFKITKKRYTKVEIVCWKSRQNGNTIRKQPNKIIVAFILIFLLSFGLFAILFLVLNSGWFFSTLMHKRYVFTVRVDNLYRWSETVSTESAFQRSALTARV